MLDKNKIKEINIILANNQIWNGLTVSIQASTQLMQSKERTALATLNIKT